MLNADAANANKVMWLYPSISLFTVHIRFIIDAQPFQIHQKLLAKFEIKF